MKRRRWNKRKKEKENKRGTKVADIQRRSRRRIKQTNRSHMKKKIKGSKKNVRKANKSVKKLKQRGRRREGQIRRVTRRRSLLVLLTANYNHGGGHLDGTDVVITTITTIITTGSRSSPGATDFD